MEVPASHKRWIQVQQLFAEVVGLDAERRSARLDRVEDPRLRKEVQTLLDRHARGEPIGPEVLFAAPEDEHGEVVGHYRLIGELGRGAMGVVYRAEDLRLKRSVALKFLTPQLSADKRARARLEREAQAASALDHPNICTVYEIGETDDGRLYLALACYDGETLERHIGRGPLEVKEAVRVAVHMARGLAAAHRHGIVHRDVKPSNVLVTDDRSVKLLDFGIARIADSDLTGSGDTLGTVAYMSPEQLRGEVDARVDVWALGVVLYEMLTGGRPFAGDYEAALLYAILHEAPAPLDRDDVPEELAEIARRCLDKDPDERYQSAEEVEVELERLRTGTASGPIPVIGRRVHRGLWVSGVLLVLATMLWFVPGVRIAVLAGVTGVKASSSGNIADTPDGTSSAEAQRYYLKGMTALERYDQPENVDMALELFGWALDADSLFALAHAGLAEASVRKYKHDRDAGWVQKAETHAARALDLAVRRAPIRVTLGQLRLLTGDYTAAASEFGLALQLDERSADAHRGLGEAYDHLGRTDQAERYLRRAVNLGPDDWRTHSTLGTFLLDHGDYPGAGAQYEQVIELEPESAMGYEGLAGVYLYQGEWDRAVEVSERSLRVQPTYVAYSYIAFAHYARGEHDKEVQTYWRALAMDSTDHRIWGNLAGAYERNDDQDQVTPTLRQAVRLVERHLTINPHDAAALIALAEHRIDLQEPDAARAAISRAAVLSGLNNDDQARIGMAYERLGNRDQAVAWVRRAIENGFPPSHLDPEYLGEVMTILGIKY